MYKGTLIKESLEDECILDSISIEGVELWRAARRVSWQPVWWTAVFFKSEQEDLPERLSQALKPKWYVDINTDNEKLIVIKDKVMRYASGDKKRRREAMAYCEAAGVPASQLDWPEE